MSSVLSVNVGIGIGTGFPLCFVRRTIAAQCLIPSLRRDGIPQIERRGFDEYLFILNDIDITTPTINKTVLPSYSRSCLPCIQKGSVRWARDA